MSKFILILGTARSGTSWICEKFYNDYNINLNEIFVKRPPYKKEDLEKIYNDSIKDNKNLIVKINHDQAVPNQNRISILNRLIELSDYILFVRRENKLAQYISWIKARKTNSWCEESNKNKNIKKDNIKIQFNHKKYTNFEKEQYDAEKNLKELIALYNKKYIELLYEDIHNHKTEEEKFLYLEKKIKEIDPDVKLKNNIFEKESNYKDLIKDNFNNFELAERFFNLKNDKNLYNEKKSIIDLIDVENIYNYKPEYELDLETVVGNLDLIKNIVKEIKPINILELGTYKGASAINMANALNELALNDSRIIFSDTWTTIVHSAEGKNKELYSNYIFLYKHGLQKRYLNFGYPNIYYRFLSNVIHTNNQKYIIPFPSTNNQILDVLISENKIKFDLIFYNGELSSEPIIYSINKSFQLLSHNGIFLLPKIFFNTAKNDLKKINDLDNKIIKQNFTKIERQGFILIFNKINQNLEEISKNLELIKYE